MISEISGLETDHRLLAEAVEADGFIAPWERRRLGLGGEVRGQLSWPLD